MILLERNSRLLALPDADLIEYLLRHSGTWALVDGLAANVAGDLAERYGELAGRLDRWATDPDFWIRRSALLALLRPLRRGGGDFERFARYADAMLEEKEFFITQGDRLGAARDGQDAALSWSPPGSAPGYTAPQASRCARRSSRCSPARS